MAATIVLAVVAAALAFASRRWLGVLAALPLGLLAVQLDAGLDSEASIALLYVVPAYVLLAFVAALVGSLVLEDPDR